MKDNYIAPYHLPVTFVLGTITLGVYLANQNFAIMSDPLSFIGCAISTGVMTMALSWVLFDLTE